MGMIRADPVEHVRAADEGGQPLDLMDQALGRQEFQRAVDGGWRRGAAVFPHSIEQVIGAGWAGTVQDEPQNLAPLFRQPLLPLFAESLGLGQQSLSLGLECRFDHRTVIT